MVKTPKNHAFKRFFGHYVYFVPGLCIQKTAEGYITLAAKVQPGPALLRPGLRFHRSSLCLRNNTKRGEKDGPGTCGKQTARTGFDRTSGRIDIVHQNNAAHIVRKGVCMKCL